MACLEEHNYEFEFPKYRGEFKNQIMDIKI